MVWVGWPSWLPCWWLYWCREGGARRKCSSGVCYSLGVQGCSCAVAGACGADVLMASCSSKAPCEYYLASLNHVPALVVVWRREGGWV